MNLLLPISMALFAVVAQTQNISEPASFRAVTKFGFFNATFSWKIENFQLYNFGQRFVPNPLTSPILTAIDYQNGRKEYTAKFIIQPTFYFTNEILNYTIKADFNQSPRKLKFFFKINGAQSFEGTKIKRAQFFDVLDTVEVGVYAIFGNRKNMTEFSPPLISPPIFGNEKQPTFNIEMLKMFQNDPNFHVLIECNAENITKWFACLSHRQSHIDFLIKRFLPRIKEVENGRAQAYKPVLQARSPILAKILQNETESFKLENFQPTIVRKMIEFCNWDCITKFEADELQIFEIGNAYQIKSLMIYATRKIVETATIENAIERYNFAVSQKSGILKKWYFSFIIDNFKEISSTFAFGNLDAFTHKLILRELLTKNKIN